MILDRSYGGTHRRSLQVNPMGLQRDYYHRELDKKSARIAVAARERFVDIMAISIKE